MLIQLIVLMPVKLDQLLLNYDQSGIDVLLHIEKFRSRMFITGQASRGETAGKEVVVNGDILSINGVESRCFPWKTVISSRMADLQAFNIVSYNCRGFNTLIRRPMSGRFYQTLLSCFCKNTGYPRANYNYLIILVFCVLAFPGLTILMGCGGGANTAAV